MYLPKDELVMLAALLALALLTSSGLVDLTNADRAAAGLPALVLDLETQPIAAQRVADQDHTALSHYDAGGQIVFTRLLSDRGLWTGISGENLGRCYCDTAVLETALMASPTHRKNILEPRFSRVAVGAVIDDWGELTVAEIFR